MRMPVCNQQQTVPAPAPAASAAASPAAQKHQATDHSAQPHPSNTSTAMSSSSTPAALGVQLRVWQQQPSSAVVQQLGGPAHPGAQALVLGALASPLCKLLPPNLAYVQRLVKAVVQAAEDARQELAEPLLQLHTALLLGGRSQAAAEDGTWRYKTFYYSSSPSWQELQQLQQQHVAQLKRLMWPCVLNEKQQQDGCCAAVADSRSRALPALQLQRLQQRQQAMSQLLAAMADACEQPLQLAGDEQQQQPEQPLTPPLQQQQHKQQQAQQQQQQLPWRAAGLLSLHASDNLFEGSTGCFMWEAGFLLAEFVLNNTRLFEGRSVLEVGCGPGLVAACLCRVGVRRLLLTDGDPQTLVNCISNLELNGHSSARLLGGWHEAAAAQQPPLPEQQVLACPLDWNEDVPGLAADVVVASDVCYDPAFVPDLVRLLAQLLPQPREAVPPERQHQQQQPPEQLGGSAEVVQLLQAQQQQLQPPPRQQQQQEVAAAYVSTTLRHPATLRLFEDAAQHAGLELQQLDTSSWLDRPGGVTFQALPALEARGERFVLHRVTRAAEAAG